MTIDLLNREALMKLQDEALRTEREAQHALAIIQLQLCLNQYGEGLLSSHELLNRIADTALKAPRLREGDTDIVNGTVFEDESPESFLQRLNESVAEAQESPDHTYIGRNGTVTKGPFKPWMKDGDFLYLDDKGEHKLWSETEALLREHAVGDGIIAMIQERYCLQAIRVGGSATTGDVVLNARYKEPDSLSEDFTFTEGRVEGAGEGHWFDLYKKLCDARLSDSLIARIRGMIHSTKHVDVVKAFDPYKGLRLVTPDPGTLNALQSFEFKGQLHEGAFVLRNGLQVTMRQKPGFANFLAIMPRDNTEIEFTSLGVALTEDRELDVLYEAAPNLTPDQAVALVNDPQSHQASVLESIAGNVAEARGDALVIRDEPTSVAEAPLVLQAGVAFVTSGSLGCIGETITLQDNDDTSEFKARDFPFTWEDIFFKADGRAYDDMGLRASDYDIIERADPNEVVDPTTTDNDVSILHVEIQVRTDNSSKSRMLKRLRVGEDYWAVTPLVEGGRYITRDLKLVVVESMFGANNTFRGSNGCLYAKNGMTMVPRGDDWVTSDGGMMTDFIYQTQRVYDEER